MTPAPKNMSAGEQAIHEMIGRFVAAWNNRDIEAMAGTYAENADLLDPFGRMVETRTGIEALLREEHAGPLQGSHYSLTIESIRFLRTDLAIAELSFELTEIHNAPNVTFEGHVTSVLEARAGRWFALATRMAIPVERPESKALGD